MISVLNVSAYAIYGKFCKHFNFVEENDLNPAILDWSETAELEDRARAAKYSKNLKNVPPLALDDFGTGYSSPKFFEDLPITLVKLIRFSRAVSEDTQSSLNSL